MNQESADRACLVHVCTPAFRSRSVQKCRKGWSVHLSSCREQRRSAAVTRKHKADCMPHLDAHGKHGPPGRLSLPRKRKTDRWKGRLIALNRGTRSASQPRTIPASPAAAGRCKEGIPTDAPDGERKAVCLQTAAGPALPRLAAGHRNSVHSMAENFKVTAHAAAALPEAQADPAHRPAPRELTQILADKHVMPLFSRSILYQFAVLNAKDEKAAGSGAVRRLSGGIVGRPPSAMFCCSLPAGSRFPDRTCRF